MRQINKGRSYEIRWADETTSSQTATFMFGGSSRPRDLSHESSGYVLAVEDRELLRYLPGKVDGSSGSVKFCNNVTLVCL